MGLRNIFIKTESSTPLQILLGIIILGLLTVGVAFLMVMLIAKTRKNPRRKAWQQATGNNAFLIGLLSLILSFTLRFTDRYWQAQGTEILALHDGRLFFSLLSIFFFFLSFFRRFFWHKNPWWRSHANPALDQQLKYALRKFRYWTLSLLVINLVFIFLVRVKLITGQRSLILLDRRIIILSVVWLFVVMYYWMTMIIKEYDRVLAHRVKPFTLYLVRGLIVPLRILAIRGLIVTVRLLGNFSETTISYFRKMNTLLLIYALIFFALELVNGWHKVLIAKSKRPNSTIDLTLVQIMVLGMRALIYGVAVVSSIQILSEQKLTALVAGLGIGGIAIALASQDLLKNIFGGFTIMLDKPFNISQRIKVQGLEGVVESIGFRSTRLRTLGGNLVTIPNTIIADNSVENVALREAIRRDIVLNFPLHTSRETMLVLIEKLRELFANQGDNFDYEQRPPRVYFGDFKEWSLVVNILYWHNSTDWWTSVLFGETLNMRIMTMLDEMNLKLAVPAQSVALEPQPTKIKLPTQKEALALPETP